jgi:hypothetical protein
VNKQHELAYVMLGPKQWSIARFVCSDDRTIEWWCGDRNEWVSPASDWWQLVHDCWNERFSSLTKARAFARKRGWE